MFMVNAELQTSDSGAPGQPGSFTQRTPRRQGVAAGGSRRILSVRWAAPPAGRVAPVVSLVGRTLHPRPAGTKVAEIRGFE